MRTLSMYNISMLGNNLWKSLKEKLAYKLTRLSVSKLFITQTVHASLKAKHSCPTIYYQISQHNQLTTMILLDPDLPR